MPIRDQRKTIFLLKASYGTVYNEIGAAFIGLRIMGYSFAFNAYQPLSFSRLRLSTYLYVLYMCPYVGVYN